MMTKTNISLEFEPIQQCIYKIKMQCTDKKINKTFINSSADSLIGSVLDELGLSTKLIAEVATSELLETNASIDVLVFVFSVKDEDYPLADVYRDGIHIGRFSVSPVMLLDEFICVEVLSLLGYKVTLDGIACF